MLRETYPDLPVGFVDAGNFTGDPTVPGEKQTDALIDGKESTIEQLDDLATAITNLATLHRQTPGTLST